MLFQQVVGQKAAKEGILNMWHQAHFPHALLVLGGEGLGGLPMALALAQFVFCTQKKDNDACGECAGCSKVLRLEHADLHLSFPTIPPKPGTKAMSRHYMAEFREFVKQTPYGTTFEWLQYINAENKQGNITAEECREIIDSLNLKSFEGGKKLMVIWRPEYLGKEGNILLKLIEEPPADTILILVAEEIEDILPTILSRTQTVRLAPIPASDIAQTLVDRSHIAPNKAAQLAHIANGNFTEALRLVQQPGNDLFPEVKQWFNALFTNNGLGITRFAEEWSKAGREQQKNFLQYVVQLLQQTLNAQYIPGFVPALSEEEADFVQKLAKMKAMTLPNLQGMVKAMTDTIYYIERNAHSRTQLHTLSIRMQYIVMGKEVAI
jgi:DNA polymerase III subunit delta'